MSDDLKKWESITLPKMEDEYRQALRDIEFARNEELIVYAEGS